MHEQGDSIAGAISRYEAALASADLPNVPFHSEPLLNGHKDYELLGPEQRKKMLVAFNVLVQRLPIRYKTFVYRRSEFQTSEKLRSRMKKDIEEALNNDLAYFQGFEHVKLYYDERRLQVRAPHRSHLQPCHCDWGSAHPIDESWTSRRLGEHERPSLTICLSYKQKPAATRGLLQRAWRRESGL